MNTRIRNRWPVGLAALTLALTAACGTDTATAPGDIGGADRGGSTPADTRQDDNPARLDFGDTGRG